jgi:hypothetical protein
VPALLIGPSFRNPAPARAALGRGRACPFRHRAVPSCRAASFLLIGRDLRGRRAPISRNATRRPRLRLGNSPPTPALLFRAVAYCRQTVVPACAATGNPNPWDPSRRSRFLRNPPTRSALAPMGRHFVSTTGACLRGLAERLQCAGGAVAALNVLSWTRKINVLPFAKLTCESGARKWRLSATQG